MGVQFKLGKQVVRHARMEMEVVGSLQIGGGKFGHPYLSLVMLEDDYPVLVQHQKGKFPRSVDYAGRNSGSSNDWVWYGLSEVGYDLMKSAMEQWKIHKTPSLTAYTFIYAYILGKGYDLVDDFGIQ